MAEYVGKCGTFVCRVLLLCAPTGCCPTRCKYRLTIIRRDTIEVQGWSVEVVGCTEQTCYKFKMLEEIVTFELAMCLFYGCCSLHMCVVKGNTVALLLCIEKWSQLYIACSCSPNCFLLCAAP